MGTLEFIGLFALFAFVVASLIMFKKVYAAYAGIMSVGSAYLITVSMIGIIGLLATLFSGKGVAAIGEVIAFLIVAAIGIFKFISAEAKCTSTKQRVLLPFAAIMLAIGVSWKFVYALITHSSMDLGVPDAVKEYEDSRDLNNMPNDIYDDNNRRYMLQGVYGDHADYRSEDTGETITLYHTSISGNTANTNLGNFHW